jgi:hypothetical protein
MGILAQYFSLEFIAYLGWQTYLQMLEWQYPDDDEPDPPDGGSSITIAPQASGAIFLFILGKSARMTGYA